MLDMVLSVIREQSVFVLMGLMIAGGLISQFMASRRYRKLRGGIQSLAALQASPASASSSRTQAGALVRSERAQRRHEEQARQERKAQRQSEQEHKSEQGDEPAKTDVFSAERTAGQAPEEELPVKAETQGRWTASFYICARAWTGSRPGATRSWRRSPAGGVSCHRRRNRSL